MGPQRSLWGMRPKGRLPQLLSPQGLTALIGVRPGGDARGLRALLQVGRPAGSSGKRSSPPAASRPRALRVAGTVRSRHLLAEPGC